jgi:hypothetical protein
LRIRGRTGAADRRERMAHEATVAIERGTQAPYRGIVGARIARTLDGHLFAEDGQRGEPDGGLVPREHRKLTTGAVAARVLRLLRIDDPLVEDGALDGNALITDWPGARVDCLGWFDRDGVRDRLRDHRPGEERGRQQAKGQPADLVTGGILHEALKVHFILLRSSQCFDGKPNESKSIPPVAADDGRVATSFVRLARLVMCRTVAAKRVAAKNLFMSSFIMTP